MSNEQLTPAQRVEKIREEMAAAAQAGVASTSVDGVSVTQMSAADRKIALDEAKKATVDRVPLFFMRWK